MWYLPEKICYRFFFLGGGGSLPPRILRIYGIRLSHTSSAVLTGQVDGWEFHAVVAEHVQKFVSESGDVVFDLGDVILCHPLVVVSSHVHRHVSFHQFTHHWLHHSFTTSCFPANRATHNHFSVSQGMEPICGPGRGTLIATNVVLLLLLLLVVITFRKILRLCQ